jgi:hypothetical protein
VFHFAESSKKYAEGRWQKAEIRKQKTASAPELSLHLPSVLCCFCLTPRRLPIAYCLVPNADRL